MKTRLFSKSVKLLFSALFLSLIFSTASAHATDFTWDSTNPGCSSGQWTDSNCWDGGIGGDYPDGSDDTATFNATDASNCDLNVSSQLTVGAVTITSDYTGTIRNTNDQNLIFNSTFNQDGGTFELGSPTSVTHRGYVTISGGYYDGQSASTITMDKEVTINGGTLDAELVNHLDLNGFTSINDTESLTMTSGTFSAPGTNNTVSSKASFVVSGGNYIDNGGTLEFGQDNIYPSNFDVNSSLTLSNLKINRAVTAGTSTVTLATDDIVTVTGTLSLDDGIWETNGNAKVVTSGASATMSVATAFSGGSGVVELQGDPAISLGSDIYLPELIINGTTVTTSGTVNFDDDFRIYSGTFSNTADATINVAGAFQQTGGTLNLGDNPARMSISGSAVFSGGDFNGDAAAQLTIEGHITINGGNLNLGDVELMYANYRSSIPRYGLDMDSGTFTGPELLVIRDDLDFDGTGTFIHSDGRIMFVWGWASNIFPNGQTFGTIELYKTAAPDILDINGPIDIDGDLIIYDGEFRTYSNNINLAGDLIACPSAFGDTTCQGMAEGSGELNHASTIILDGQNQRVGGNFTSGNNADIINLTKTVTSADTLTFEEGKTTQVAGTLTLQGADSNLLSLRSSDTTSPITQFNLNSGGSYTMSYLDVQGSNASGSNFYLAGSNSVNSGDNTGWDFGASVTNLTYNSTSGNFEYGDTLSASYSIADGTHGRVNWLIDSVSPALINMPFDGNNNSTGGVALDISGNGNNATVYNGASFSSTSGHDSRGAYWFDGSNDYIARDNFNPTDPHNVTLSAWISANEITASGGNYNNFIITKGGDNSYNSYGIYLSGQGDAPVSTSYLSMFTYGPSYGSNRYKSATSPLVQDQWYHVAMVIDGNEAILYQDGTEVARDTINGTITTTTSPLNIGRQYRGTYWYYHKGYIDDVLVIDEALSETEIQSLYNNGLDQLPFEAFPTKSYQACITPYNGSTNSVGIATCTSDQTISWDGVSAQALTSTSGGFANEDDITATYTINNGTHGMVNWIKNSSSWTALNIPMDGDNGDENTISSDLSGNGNHGTVIGASWESKGGHDGYGAYSFDGINDAIYKSDTASLSITGEISIELWAYFDDLSNYQSLVSKYDYEVGERGMILNVNDTGSGCAAGELTWVISSTGNPFTGASMCSNSGFLTTTGWHHIVATYVPSSEMKIYIDGVDQTDTFGSGSSVPTSINDNDRPLVIGAGTTNSLVPDDYWFDGKIDEVRIYNESLSPEQISSLYTNGLDTVVSEELTVGDVWNANITAFDNSTSGAQSPPESTGDQEIYDDPFLPTTVPEFTAYTLVLTAILGTGVILRREMKKGQLV